MLYIILESLDRVTERRIAGLILPHYKSPQEKCNKKEERKRV